MASLQVPYRQEVLQNFWKQKNEHFEPLFFKLCNKPLYTKSKLNVHKTFLCIVRLCETFMNLN